MTLVVREEDLIARLLSLIKTPQFFFGILFTRHVHWVRGVAGKNRDIKRAIYRLPWHN